MSLRWKRQPKDKGLAGVCQGERGFDLCENGITIGYVRPLFKGLSREKVGYYWYGCSKNTSNVPVETIEEAKSKCLEHCKLMLSIDPELQKQFGRSKTAHGSTGCP